MIVVPPRAGWRRMSAALGLLVGLLAGPVARAQDDPPGRVGRLADFQGVVSTQDAEQASWQPALRNRPLTTGDRLATGRDARAEVRVGSTVLRLGSGTELEVQRLDDDRMHFRLHAGSLALRVASREVADEIVVTTLEARLRPLSAGHFRVDRRDGTTFASSWRGALRVDDEFGFDVDPGRRVELWREAQGRALRHTWVTPLDDGFSAWIAEADRRDERTRYSVVSPEMTGAEDLDDHGRWDQHPDYGAVWIPQALPADWAPYRFGYWAWVQPWGWTWVDDAPWGFAPFHYGRWVHWRGRWCWTPGAAVARPVFAPALVAWVRGPHLSVGLDAGWGWVPLAPYEPYRPHYRHSPRYRDRIDPPWPSRGQRPPRQVPSGPVMYGNQGVPGGVTVVPSTALQQGPVVVRVPRGDPKDEHRARPVARDRPLETVEPPRLAGRRPDAPRRVGDPARIGRDDPARDAPVDQAGGPPAVRHVPGGAVPIDGRSGDADANGRRGRDRGEPRATESRGEPPRPSAARDEPPKPPRRLGPETPPPARPQGPMPTRPALRGHAETPPAAGPQPPVAPPRMPPVQALPPAAREQPPATRPRPPQPTSPPQAQPPHVQPRAPAARPQAPVREREADRERKRDRPARSDEGRGRTPEARPTMRDRQQTQ